jgi:hypothetical protein
MVEKNMFLTLPDPCNDRVLSEKDCPTLVNRPLPDDVLFKKNLPDWKVLRELQSREGPLTKDQTCRILKLAIN